MFAPDLERTPRRPSGLAYHNKGVYLAHNQRGACGVKFYDFDVVTEKEPEDEGYYAYVPGLPGCFSNGQTIEETRRNIREAVQQHIANLHAHGEPID